jgi:hypothetical protein
MTYKSLAGIAVLLVANGLVSNPGTVVDLEITGSALVVSWTAG